MLWCRGSRALQVIESKLRVWGSGSVYTKTADLDIFSEGTCSRFSKSPEPPSACISPW